MPYYKRFVCVELYVPVAVEADNEYLAKKEICRRCCNEGFLFKYDRKKDLVRKVLTFPEDDDNTVEVTEEEYKSIKTKL